jgi:hypothetical protein
MLQYDYDAHHNEPSKRPNVPGNHQGSNRATRELFLENGVQ